MTVAALKPVEVHVRPVLALQVDRECAMEDIGAATRSGFAELGEAAGRAGIPFAGPPRAIYTDHSPTFVRFTLAIPVPESTPVDERGPVRVTTLAGGRALRFTHVGPYDGLAETYGRITEWLMAEGQMKSEADWARFMPMWEEYQGDPETTRPEDLVTHIHLPLE
jgi:effector-binding domain-containing protein